MSKMKLVLLVSFVLLVVVVSPALAAPIGQEVAELPSSPEIPGLVKVLELLAQGIGIGFVVAFMFEKPGWFSSLPDNTKWWIILGLSLGLPVLAQMLLDFVPPDIWAQIEPYWLAIARGFMVWAGSQAAFKVFIKGKL